MIEQIKSSLTTQGVQVLYVIMVIDVVLGSMRAIRRKINKNGDPEKLNSTKGTIGLFKKIAILSMIPISHLLDILLETSIIANGTLFYAIGLELLSVKENLNKLGVDVSPSLDVTIKTTENKGGKNSIDENKK